ncbi:mucin-5AC-like isoform X2 [Mya arenaria]|uniref:mucin-5AC-like isoform X2 n=1 Tax=Mya arenaria TaxID=6604 RepID=UPI0022E1C82A|nr:mucin-5AC-like isoform X2 [Mya arenaria]
MRMPVRIVCISFLLAHITYAATNGLLCFNCDDVASPRDCTRVEYCQHDQACSVELLQTSTNRTFYKMGCYNTQECTKQQHTNGRRSSRTQNIHGQSRAAGDKGLCLECSSDLESQLTLCGAATSTELHCFNCNDLVNPSQCDTVRECSTDEDCFIGIQPVASGTGEYRYQLGCKSKPICSVLNSVSSNVLPSRCCNSSLCNLAIDSTSSTIMPSTPSTSTQTPSQQMTYTTALPTTMTMTTTTKTTTTSTATAPTTTPTTTTSTTTTTKATSTSILPTQSTFTVYIEGPYNSNYKHPVTLTCVTNKPAQKIIWSLNGESGLPPGVHVMDYTLSIDSLDLHTAGNYSCLVVWNGQLKIATKQVIIPPKEGRVVKFSHHLDTGSGIVTFVCQYEGYPPPSVTWAYSGPAGTDLPRDLNISKDHVTGVIAHYNHIHHDGTYLCIVSNVLNFLTPSVGTTDLP